MPSILGFSRVKETHKSIITLYATWSSILALNYIFHSSPCSTSHVSNASGADTSIPVIQSVSSLAGAGMPSARPDTLPTQPVPPSQLSPAPPPAPIPPPPPQIINRTVTETMVSKTEKNLNFFNSLDFFNFVVMFHGLIGG